MELTITSTNDESARAVLSATGALDLQSRGELLEAARTSLNGPITALVLDLSAITFIDSSGIGALVQLFGDSADADIPFVIRDPSARVTRILDLTGLLDAWTIERGDAA
jgi:anti-sigma B factor antagonist